MDIFVWLSEKGLEQKYVKEAFDSNGVVHHDPNVNSFEALLLELRRARY